MYIKINFFSSDYFIIHGILFNKLIGRLEIDRRIVDKKLINPNEEMIIMTKYTKQTK